MTFYLALAAAVLSAAQLILHVVSPHTKWTGDDKLEAIAVKLKGYLEGK
jgi:hypothetical protein